MKSVEEMNKTTLEAQNHVVPAESIEGSEIHGHGGGDGNKDDSFGEKENTQFEKREIEDSEQDESYEQQQNEVSDPELQNSYPSLQDGFYEVETIRRKRFRKGKLEYFVKWLGWDESENTWEPSDNLVGLPELVESFENGLKSKSTKNRKRKHKHVVHGSQFKKRVERSATPYSLRCLKSTSKAHNNHSQAAAKNSSQSAPHNEQPFIPHIRDTPAFPRTVLFADEVEDSDDESNLGKENHVNHNWSVDAPKEVPRYNEEKECDLKLSERKATTINGNDIDNVAIQFQEVVISPEKTTHMNDQQNAVCTEPIIPKNAVCTEPIAKEDAVYTEPIAKENAVCTEPVKNGPGRLAHRRRKSITVKRFKIDSCAEAAQTGATDNAIPRHHKPTLLIIQHKQTSTEPVKPACDIVKIVKPVGYTSPVASTMQEVVVTFKALRSDGSEVMVDNIYLKTNHPLLLIDYYEQHLRYNPRYS